MNASNENMRLTMLKSYTAQIISPSMFSVSNDLNINSEQITANT